MKGDGMSSGQDETRSHELVGSIYDSIAAPARWHDTLGKFCSAFDGTLAFLADVDVAAPDANFATSNARFAATWGPPGLVGPLIDGTVRDNPFFDVPLRLEIDVPVTLSDVHELQGPQSRDRWQVSSMHLDWALPNGLNDFIWLPVIKTTRRAVNLIVITGRSRPEITPEELAVFADLAPHVRRAVSIGNLFETWRSETDLFAQVLDALNCGVLIVDSSMTLVYANPAGEELVRARGLLRSQRGRLDLRWPVARQAVKRAVALGEESEIALGTLGIGAPLAPGDGAVAAHVMPLARREPEVRVDRRAAAAIFIAAPDQACATGIEAVAALFGLTAAEKRVAGQVAQGMTRGDIADANGVAPGTVKAQLSAIFDKTGASDQRTLEGLIRDLSPPLRKG